MRLERIDLTRFGCFTDQAVDFGPVGSGPDLHIVYGDNEAGKSTLRDAITAFLFGIPVQTPYRFLHDYSALRIGAVVSIGAQRLSAVRIKARSETLRSEEDTAISEAPLKAGLGSIDEEDYCRLFSLDRVTLVAGGDDILRAKGELGALLFAGASGLSSVGAVLGEVRDRADAFYKPRARSTLLAKALTELDRIRSRLAEIDVQAPAYRKMADAEAEAKGQYEEAKAAREAKAKSLAAQKAVLDAVEPWRAFLRQRERLEALGPVPEARQDDLEEARRLEKARVRQSTESDAARNEVERVVQEIEGLTKPPYADALAQGLAAIADEDLERPAGGARRDLPKRQDELLGLDRAILDRLKTLGRPDEAEPRSLIWPDRTMIALNESANDGERIDTAFQAAKTENAKASAKVESARQAVEDLPAAKDPSALVDAFESVRNRLDQGRLLELEGEVAEAARNREAAFRPLAPWKGSFEELASLQPVNAEDVAALDGQERQMAQERARLESELDRLAKELARESAAVRQWEDDPDFVSDQKAAARRHRRDELWRAHRSAIDDGDLPSIVESADAFEAALSDHDQAAQQRLARSADLAQARERGRARAEAAAALEQSEAAVQRLRKDEDAFRSRREAVMLGLGLPSDMSLAALRDWLRDRTAAIVAADAEASRVAALERRRESATAAAATLRQALEATGLTEPVEDQLLLATAERRIGLLRQQTEDRRLGEQALKAALQEEKRRRTDLQSASADREEWLAAWNALVRPLWCGDVSTSQMRNLIEQLKALGPELEQRDALEQRIAAMQRDYARFAKAVSALAERTGLGDPEADPLTLFGELEGAAENCRHIEQKLAGLAERLKKATETQEKQIRKLELLDAEVAVLLERSGQETLAGAIETLAKGVEAASCRERLEEHRRTLIGILGVDDEAAWKASLEGPTATPDRLEEHRLAYDAAQNEAELEHEELRQRHAAWKDAERHLASIGGGEEAARLEQDRATILSEIEEQAEEYLRLTAGTLMVDEAVKLFRDSHRGSMMEAASAAFARMTQGRYPRLVTVNSDDGEILVAEKKDGGTIETVAMSEGTRTQLYLALRVAGHAEFAQTRTPLPFIADDILEAFDDTRAKAAFDLLCSMAERGQVIYLTHHRHLVEIARETTQGGVRLHELD